MPKQFLLSRSAKTQSRHRHTLVESTCRRANSKNAICAQFSPRRPRHSNLDPGKHRQSFRPVNYLGSAEHAIRVPWPLRARISAKTALTDNYALRRSASQLAVHYALSGDNSLATLVLSNSSARLFHLGRAVPEFEKHFRLLRYDCAATGNLRSPPPRSVPSFLRVCPGRFSRSDRFTSATLRRGMMWGKVFSGFQSAPPQLACGNLPLQHRR